MKRKFGRHFQRISDCQTLNIFHLLFDTQLVKRSLGLPHGCKLTCEPIEKLKLLPDGPRIFRHPFHFGVCSRPLIYRCCFYERFLGSNSKHTSRTYCGWMQRLRGMGHENIEQSSSAVSYIDVMPTCRRPDDSVCACPVDHT